MASQIRYGSSRPRFGVGSQAAVKGGENVRYRGSPQPRGLALHRSHRHPTGTGWGRRGEAVPLTDGRHTAQDTRTPPCPTPSSPGMVGGDGGWGNTTEPTQVLEVSSLLFRFFRALEGRLTPIFAR